MMSRPRCELSRFGSALKSQLALRHAQHRGGDLLGRGKRLGIEAARELGVLYEDANALAARRDFGRRGQSHCHLSLYPDVPGLGRLAHMLTA